MPFTLAHPAAVLPFKRYCPRLLDFPALVIGSLSPDAGYAFGRLNVEDLSHSPIGSVAFCLPAGIVVTVLFYLLRVRFVEILPASQRRLLEPLTRQPRGAWYAIVLSVLIGVWTHLLWDSFTHKNGWLVERLSVLQLPLVPVGGRILRMSHVLWYLCTFGGVAWLYFRFEQWRRISSGAPRPAHAGPALLRAAVVGAVSLVIAAIHHVVQGWMGVWAAAVLSLLLLAGILARREKPSR